MADSAIGNSGEFPGRFLGAFWGDFWAMSAADFIHLRVHSAYSLSEGALKIQGLVDLCARHKMPAMAITDSGNLFGALEFSQSCAKAGIQPIVGCQLAVAAEPAGDRPSATPPLDQLVLLAKDPTGYENLLKLVSQSYMETDPGLSAHITMDQLGAHHAGLIALTGGVRGTIGRMLLAGQRDAAERLLGAFQDIFADRLYVEIQRHNMVEEQRTETSFVELADAFKLPLVATNEAFFADRDMFDAHDALLCVAEGAYVGQDERRRLTPDHYFTSAQEMKTRFADMPEAIDNTLVIAQRCAVMSEPKDPILPRYSTAAGRSEAEQLRHEAETGLAARLDAHVFTDVMDAAAREEARKPYLERLDYELGVIEQMGFPGYFLIVADFIKWAKEQDIPVGPGRGSGAGSVVAWALTITDLDPLRWALLFERFLNPERVSMPDFDIDFCQDRRDEVIRYVQEKYGHDKVAQIITFGKLQARAVLRDVGRVLQMPYSQVDRLCKMVPNNPTNPVTLQQAIDGEPQLQEQRQQDETVARLLDIALKLEGLYRHASTHAAGVVIGDRPLDSLVPLYRDPRSDMPVTQFNMKFVEQAGLVKFDFLGLKTLTVLVNAIELLQPRGIALDLETIPLDDAPSYAMMGQGDTTGVFQLESQGMRDVLRRMKPDRFEDIIAIVALYRPGPMENIPSYINRKQGREETSYLDPSLAPVLSETYGIIIYQEQVMQIAQVLAGYTLGGADLLRRAMGKKIQSEMDAQRQVFVDGAVARGTDKAKASQIFDLVDKFAGYGFNKSHAAAYALVAYQTAYLKANYPVEFFAASMTYDMGNTDKLNSFRRELQRLKIDLLPPDVNKSEARFSVEDGAVRYALGALKNVGVGAMEALVAARKDGGPFTSIEDFAQRLDNTVINKRLMENLVRSGALDCLNPNRQQLYQGIESILKQATAAANERNSDQDSLFGSIGDSNNDMLRLPAVPDWPVNDRLRHEFEAVGLYLSAHPLDDYAQSLKRLNVTRSDEFAASGGRGASVKMAGTIIGKKERRSAKGSRYAFIQISDSAGMFELTAFSEVLVDARELIEESLENGKPVLVQAEVQKQEDSVRLTAQTISALDDAVRGTAAGLRVYLSEADAIDPLKNIIDQERPGRGTVTAVVTLADCEVEIDVRKQAAISPGTRQALKSIPGIAHVEEI